MSGKPWYNNGIKEIQIGNNEIIPDGFVRGRLPLTDEQKKLRTTRYLDTINNKSQEERDLINKKRSQSLHNTYQSKSEDEKQSIIDRRIATMQNKSDEEKALYRQHLSDGSKGKNLGKEPWNKGLSKETDERVKQNAINTSKGVIKHNKELLQNDPEYFNKWRSNINDVMRMNNTFNTSNAEDNYFLKLKEMYGDDNVIRWYSDERYPFACDFYIPSEDLFIEYNKTWTHGGHPFDEMNLDDIYKLETWEEKAKTSKYYQNAIYTWTDLDVRKQKIAKENKLNYKVIY